MTADHHEAGRRHLRKAGAHRKAGKQRKALTRAVATGGAAMCVGAAYDLSTPNADALSILLPGRTVNGVGNTTRINIFEGNIFSPQLGGNNVSNNSTVGNVAIGQGSDDISSLLNTEIRLGGAAGNGNTTQINIWSYNIFNPQISLGRNVSNNTSVNNVAMDNGNNNTTDAASAGGLLPWFGGATGNGNTVQFSFFSGNIFNPRWSLDGGNLSNNTSFTNVAIGNGNYGATTVSLGGWFGTFLSGGGNCNTTQYGFFVSNIYNPQFALGGGNISYNSAATNTAIGNGNNSTNEVTGGAVGGTTGNGNTNQVATGSGNIVNDQVNIGPGGATTVTSNTGGSGGLEQVVASLAVGQSTSDGDWRTDAGPAVLSDLEGEAFGASDDAPPIRRRCWEDPVVRPPRATTTAALPSAPPRASGATPTVLAIQAATTTVAVPTAMAEPTTPAAVAIPATKSPYERIGEVQMR